MEAVSIVLLKAWAFIKSKVTWIFVASSIGAVFGVLASPKMTGRAAFIYVISGSFIGGSCAKLIGWWCDIPDGITPYLASLLALPGIGGSVSIIHALKDPIQSFTRLRGKK